jgi:hypothetical protein
MNVRQLIALLQKLPPHAEVCTWDAGVQQDLCIEQVLLCDGHKTPVVVLGMEIEGDIVEGAEIVWTAGEPALKGLHKAQGMWARARREAVG